jgi:hypothetical protein
MRRSYIALPLGACMVVAGQIYFTFTLPRIDIKVKQSRYTPWRRLGGEEV